MLSSLRHAKILTYEKTLRTSFIETLVQHYSFLYLSYISHLLIMNRDTYTDMQCCTLHYVYKHKDEVINEKYHGDVKIHK